MNLVPEFQIGLLNTWLLTIPIFLSGILIVMTNKAAAKRARDMSGYNEREKKIITLCMTPYYLFIIYSIFVPLKLGTIWFTAGFIIFIFCFIAQTNAYVIYRATPLDEPAMNGVYKISRNPQYFFNIIAFLGVAVAGMSWLMMLFVILYVIPQHLIIIQEEQFCLEKYGDSYREYMSKTPRYIGIVKTG
jgi:protein-S-isoprenylcysteine O-methyltransferase Ste14